MTMLTKKELITRWKVSGSFIDGLSTNKLPKIDISGGAKRRTYRYRLEDIIAYEKRFIQKGLEQEAPTT